MAAITAYTFSSYVALHRRNSFKAVSLPYSSTTNLISPRLMVVGVRTMVPKRAYRALAISESESESELRDSSKDATIDIKLPRRRLLIQFTCNECGERTQRLINPLAYERGLVYVKCAGCMRHHKLVDNLGLVVEYDLREEINMESNIDEFDNVEFSTEQV